MRRTAGNEDDECKLPSDNTETMEENVVNSRYKVEDKLTVMKMTMSGLDGSGRGGGGASGDVSASQVTLVDRVYTRLCFTSAYDNEFKEIMEVA